MRARPQRRARWGAGRATAVVPAPQDGCGAATPGGHLPQASPSAHATASRRRQALHSGKKHQPAQRESVSLDKRRPHTGWAWALTLGCAVTPHPPALPHDRLLDHPCLPQEPSSLPDPRTTHYFRGGLPSAAGALVCDPPCPACRVLPGHHTLRRRPRRWASHTRDAARARCLG